MNKGKLIVIEGIDGSGKSTQFKMTCDALSARGIDFHKIVFPRYDKDSSALIRMYLNGEFGGNPGDVNAYTASVFYAVDRYASFVSDWRDYYNAGGLILADRYTTSNAVHQGSKLEGAQREEYFRWLSDLEYTKMGLPKPNMVIYMDVDIETSMNRMRKREKDTNTHADIHEKDTDYLANCLKVAKSACGYYGWTGVPAKTPEGKERTAEDINSQIVSLILSVTENE